MKRARFTDEQIIGMLKELGERPEDGRCLPQAWNIRGNLLQIQGEVWRYGCLRRSEAEGLGR